jgi:3'-phosphoadenosine 5'-phosphosulfate sulfotransferase (PAPS reductase)/FAD synthetase
MKNYLSFGGGVNSVAMQIILLKEGWDFESIFVNHGTDWPETYEYFDIFQRWLKTNGHRTITVLKPNVQGYSDLYNYYLFRKNVPSIMRRDCTDKFKLRPIYRYIERPCFQLIGIDAGESHRAKIATRKGVENRWPLIEYEIDRAGCKKIITDAGLPVPMKSGCYICPFQRVSQWKELRRKHPCLFMQAVNLEKLNIYYRKKAGKKPFTLRNNKQTLQTILNETQQNLFPEIDDYPPCECGL